MNGKYLKRWITILIHLGCKNVYIKIYLFDEYIFNDSMYSTHMYNYFYHTFASANWSNHP
jgi:hypothetical protein